MQEHERQEARSKKAMSKKQKGKKQKAKGNGQKEQKAMGKRSKKAKGKNAPLAQCTLPLYGGVVDLRKNTVLRYCFLHSLGNPQPLRTKVGGSYFQVGMNKNHALSTIRSPLGVGG